VERAADIGVLQHLEAAADFRQREVFALEAPDQVQTVEMRCAVARRGSMRIRRREQTLLDVLANRADRDAGAVGELVDVEVFWCHGHGCMLTVYRRTVNIRAAAPCVRLLCLQPVGATALDGMTSMCSGTAVVPQRSSRVVESAATSGKVKVRTSSSGA